MGTGFTTARCAMSIAGIVGFAAAACTSDRPDADGTREVGTSVVVESLESAAPSAGDAAESTSTLAPVAETTVPPATDSNPDNEVPELPATVLYLPSELPNEWSIRTVRTFPDADAETLRSQRTYVAHPVEGGFAAGGILVSLAEYPDTDAAGAATAEQLGVGATIVAVAGFEQGRFAAAPGQAGHSTLAVVRDAIGVSLTGIGPVKDLVAVAESLRLASGGADPPSAETVLTGWALDDVGVSSGRYELDFDSPFGLVSVTVEPGKTRSSLYISGADYRSVQLGTVGDGYYAVRRDAPDGSEFPRVVWWVPDVLLTGVSTDSVQFVVQLLDTFIAVDVATFLDMTDAATFVEGVPGESRTVPDGGDSSRPIDGERLDAMVAFIESYVGRSFVEPPEVRLVDNDTSAGTVPPGTFVTDDHWNLYRALSLVTPDHDRLAADAVRIEQIKGGCCPVRVVEQSDPHFNEVVIVHELTHGLDEELNRGTTVSMEPLDPALALVEGNAHRVAFAFADLLEVEGAELPDPPAVFINPLDPRLPDAMRELLEFPYDEGRLFAAALVDRGGEQAIIDAFADPPTTSEQILDPEAYLAGEGAESVDPPDPVDASAPWSTGSIGAFTLRLLLERSMDSAEAHALALSWSGDRYSLYGETNAPCIIATIAIDNESSATSVANALAGFPLGAVINEVERDGTSISLTRCAAR